MALTAREKFTIGQRVKLSAEGLQRLAGADPVYGEVIGFARRVPHVVRVVKDGNRTASAYHMDFWTGADVPQVTA